MELQLGPAASLALITILALEFLTTAKLMELAPINLLALPLTKTPSAPEPATASSQLDKLLEFVEPAMLLPPHAVLVTHANLTTPA